MFERESCNRSVGRLAILCVLLLMPFCRGECQTGYLFQLGTPPFTAAEPVENGIINLSNGNLRLEIPVGTFPQRGGTVLTPKFVYNSRMWSMVNTGTSAVWTPANPWTSFSGFPAGIANTSTYVRCGSSGYYVYSNFTFTDENGTSHPFLVTTGQDGSPASGCTPPASSATGYASDSSGFMIVAGAGASGSYVYYPDGTKFSPTCGQGCQASRTDTNGNWVQQSSVTTVSDTLGRSLSAFTVPNSQGSILSFSVQAVSIPVSTNFGVPGVAEFSGTISVYRSITLPDGSTYQFQYDNYGELSSMTLPTGGQVTFTYTNFTDATQTTNRWVTGRGSAGGPGIYTLG